MKIKLIAIDIDGTLLNSQKKLTQENKRAIRRAKEKGVRIVLCTGRPLRSMYYLIEELDLFDEQDLAVTYNGGLIQYTQTEQVLFQRNLTLKQVQNIYRLLNKLELPTNFIDLDYIYELPYPKGRPSIYQLDKKAHRHAEDLIFKWAMIEDFSDQSRIIKAVASRPSEELDVGMAKIPQPLFKELTIFKSQPHILEFLPQKVSKGHALGIIANHLGIEKSEIMGIGDQENDLSLVTEAGLGIAMGNAIPRVQKVADYITKSNDHHGVAYAINRFILNK